MKNEIRCFEMVGASIEAQDSVANGDGKYCKVQTFHPNGSSTQYAMELFDPAPEKDYKAMYDEIAQSEWFKTAYENGSLELPQCVPEISEREVNIIAVKTIEGEIDPKAKIKPKGETIDRAIYYFKKGFNSAISKGVKPISKLEAALNDFFDLLNTEDWDGLMKNKDEVKSKLKAAMSKEVKPQNGEIGEKIHNFFRKCINETVTDNPLNVFSMRDYLLISPMFEKWVEEFYQDNPKTSPDLREESISEMGIEDLVEKFNPNYRLDWRQIIKDAEKSSGVKLGEAFTILEKVIQSHPTPKLDREELVSRLASVYNKDMLTVATICDEVLDRTGGLLGDVREAARKEHNKE